MKKTELSKEHNEVLLDLHLINKPVPSTMRIGLGKLIDKKGNITQDGIKAVHAYVAKRNQRNWIDK